ncbi:glycoside hydrolase family 9 protein [Streptomonospora nanhaiensis]|uniref:Endoglucanase n=1 Tax=Streptomonospora nanhaiensis TaxID=1323731 RepID=A0A853BKS1_9ACTN|nr:glycoside hydrolase family 9 protein [Streptomonospora nanhaiensis]MBV2365880.1 glycoside hydrolase family 9 protein [Streptomonospora nanhaiensis]NYI95257.1 endoglucanase [Streptomonospora nanhaiensis]
MSPVSPRVRHAAGAVTAASALALSLLAGAPAAADEAEQVVNGGFDNGTTGWWHTENTPAQVVDGRLCAEVEGGTVNAWDAIVGQDDIDLAEGESYELTFTASATTDVAVRALVQEPVAPYTTYLAERPVLSGEAQTFSYVFTSTTTRDDAQLAFQLGGADEAWTFCLDDVSLTGGAEPPEYDPDTGPPVRVNQVGYLPDGPKNATLVTEATTALPWELADASGEVVAEGETVPEGVDPSSGENVHSIDFGDYTGEGTGYTLTADGATSHPFDISGAFYEDLRVDALSLYYPQRSGIEISDEIMPGYGREAGHVGVPPNQGDTSVPCAPGSGCDYELDVSGGWYDAGDHGKYVVNGGISASQVMSVWERTTYADTASPDRLGDNTLPLPEHDNGVPDVLDEARWEMEFLLSMQVPEGEDLAGMAHHKIHDAEWTGLPLMPADDPQPRYLQPPSTAATLNLAATGAQCARVFEPYDADFAARCLAAAETAWQAALDNPEVYAPATGVGGGPYNDDNVEDEFYWAAAELFITTGEQVYEDAVMDSPQHTEDVFTAAGFSWGAVAPLGRMNLAAVPNDLPDRDRVVDSVVAGADRYLETVAEHPYGLPYAPEDGEFVWGSNSQVLNNMVVMAAAFDLTGDTAYRDGVVEGMDYILGRNALNQSYVTGYGENAAENQHSRWYAHQLDPDLPNPPPGTLSGGPNSVESTWDPVAQENLEGCAPQFCYIDDIESWATNELTINWNAPLAIVASFVADQTGGGGDPEDRTPPSAPGAPKASDVTADGATLAWEPATDEGGSGLAGYDVYRVTGDGAERVGTTREPEFAVTGLEPETEYTYRVVARDGAGNESEPSASVTFTTSPEGGGGETCAVDYRTHDWSGGFTGSVTVTNTGDAPIRAWELAFDFTAGQTLTHGWSAEWAQRGATVTAKGMSWNRDIAPGASVTAGFNGRWSGSNPAPEEFTVNGETCA